MRERKRRERGGRMGEGQGRQGARARAGWAGSHRGAKNPRHAQPPIGIRSRTEIRNETNTRLNTTSNKRNMLRHDATLMST
jgi:hypothetical protein